MKSVFLVSFLLACALVNVSAQAINEAEISEAWKSAISRIGSNSDLQHKVAKVFTAAVLERMQTKMEGSHIDTNEVEPKLDICILTPLSNLTTDVVPLKDQHINAPSDSEYSGLLNGQFHSCDATLTGLKEIEDCVSVSFPPQLITIRLGYKIQTGTIKLSGVHATAMELLLGLIRLEGFGDFDFEIDNFYLNLAFTVEGHWRGMNVTNVVLDIDWSRMSMHTGESSLGGTPINWNFLTTEITEWFKVIWPFAKEIAQPLVGNVLTGIVEKCLLIDIINGFKCLQNNLLSNALVETGLNNLFEYNTDAVETCTTKITNPPIPTTPARVDPVDNAARTLELSYLAILGLLSVVFITIRNRRL